ncbi:MAG: Ig-like domain-containing protein, partial [Chloroflexota bacterium]
ATGVISGTVDAGTAAASPYTVEITVSDDGTPVESASVTFQWTVDASGAVAPTAEDDSTTVMPGDTISIDVTANDTFVGTPNLVVSTPPAEGVATVNGTSIDFDAAGVTPGAMLTFIYTLTDDSGLNDTATVTIAVMNTSGPAVAVDVTPATQAIPTGAETTFNITIRNIGAVDLNITLTSTETSGGTAFASSTCTTQTTALPIGGTGTLTCVDADVNADYDRTFTVEDTTAGVTASDSASVTTAPNQPPTINPDTATMTSEQTATIDVLANDVDPEGLLDPSSVTIVTPPTSGAITNINPTTGVITYVAPTVESAAAINESAQLITFEYQVCDTSGACGTATVTITVNPAGAGTSVSSGAPNIGVFDPAISKLGLLVPGQLGVQGEQLEWVITVRNTGTDIGYDVVVRDTLRPELRIERVEATRGTTSVDGQTVTLTLPQMAPGDAVQMSIFTTVVDGGVPVDNTACVTASNGAAEECVTALPVSTLPATGESPWSAVRPAILAALALMGLAAAGWTGGRIRTMMRQ